MMKDQDGENVAGSRASTLDNLDVPMTMADDDVSDAWEEKSVEGDETNNEIKASMKEIVIDLEKTSNNVLTQERKKKRKDMRQQAMNLNGMDVDDVIPENQKRVRNINFPPGDPKLHVVKKVKTSYWLHNRLHIQEKLHAPTLVRELVRILRKADPTVLILPFAKDDQSQNDVISNEHNIPDEEEEIKKWIGVATKQPKQKFAFSMRISITEKPEVVKGRIFDWCKGEKNWVEFKEISSANIFFAGWLYGVHPKYHNRDSIKDWIVSMGSGLNQTIHLAPTRLFTTTNEGRSKTITNGIRVEVSFENREKVLKTLYRLQWEKGPYKGALFIPFRSSEIFTGEMQKKFMQKQNAYLEKTKQRVFRMKGAEWEIANMQTGETTTF